MSRDLHIDPFGGAAGDMLLGALLDLGADQAAVREVLDGLDLPDWRLEVSRTVHQGLAGVRVLVVVECESHPARRLADVERLLSAARLPEVVRDRAVETFRRLFHAEAEVHGCAVEDAHLHELAAVDAVVDIVGVCAAIEALGISRVTCGPVPVGRGTVDTAHGTLPVPPPAVASLLRGVPVAGHAVEGEMTTPTGAALLATLVDSFRPLPGGRLVDAGTGLGTRTFAGLPNVLRALLVEPSRPPAASRPMALIECTVDDVTGERIAHLVDRLAEAGARDAWSLAGTGRKGRPVQELRVLCDEERSDALVAILFAEGATLGVRVVACARPEIERFTVAVATPFGEIPIKVGVHAGTVVFAKPEHDACRSAATAHSVPLARVEDAARAAAPRLGSAAPPSGSRA